MLIAELKIMGFYAHISTGIRFQFSTQNSYDMLVTLSLSGVTSK